MCGVLGWDTDGLALEDQITQLVAKMAAFSFVVDFGA